MLKTVISNVKTAEYKEVNLNRIFQPDKQHKKSFEFQKSNVTNPAEAGEGKLSVAFYILQPGKASYPYHYHMGNEELFYIISGCGTLKTPDGDKDVSEGDIIFMPANENGAHQLINTSNAPLTYLDVDTMQLNSAEVVVYPDTGKFNIMNNGKTVKVFNSDTAVNYLDGE